MIPTANPKTKILSALASGALCFAASAVTWTFTGGADDGGKWSSRANWQDAAGEGAMSFAEDDSLVFPSGGAAVNDLDGVAVSNLTFSGAAAFTLSGNPFALGAGGVVHASSKEVTISNDFTVANERTPLALDGAGDDAIGELTLRGVVSGAGGLEKTGRGDLNLWRDNPFEGGFYANGTGYTKDGKGPIDNSFNGVSCFVRIYAGGAMGTKEAVFSEKTPSSRMGCNLVVRSPDGEKITVSTPKIQFSQADNVNSTLECWCDVDFDGEVHNYGRSRFYLGGANRQVRFLRPFDNGDGWFIYASSWEANQCVWFDDVCAGPCTLYLGGGIKTHFCAPGNSCGTVNLQSPVYFDCADAIVRDMNAPSGLKQTFYLEGHDQTTWIGKFSGDYRFEVPADCRFDSPVGKPANLVLAQTANWKRSFLTFKGQLTGGAGLTWSPVTNDYCQCYQTIAFDGVASRTVGEMKATCGAIVFTNNASFNYLSKLSLTNLGDVVVRTGSSVRARELVLSDGRKLTLERGVTLVAKRAAVIGADGEISTLADGDYAEGDYVSGEGTLRVDSHRASEWIAGDGDWNDNAMWMDHVPPEAGDAVDLSAGGVVTGCPLDVQFGDFTVGGGAVTAKLVLAVGADKQFKVGALNVGDKGVVTTDGPFADAVTNRLLISCSSLNVAAGGRIDVSERGWKGGCYDGKHPRGYGLAGAGAADWGATHFGFGGHAYSHSSQTVPFVYDDPLAPSLPGSGGYRGSTESRTANWSLAGGGVVRIVCAGDAVVNGEILADGGDSTMRSRSFYEPCSAGAGGSVWISAATISGAGRISADGGDGSDPRYPYMLHREADWPSPKFTPSDGDAKAAGGGGIALEYGEGQTAAMVAGMRISAACGVYPNDVAQRAMFSTCDKWHTEADLGTLHFTDRKIVDGTLGRGLSGRLIDDFAADYVYDGDLAWTSGYVRFCGEGASVKIAGDLALSGENSRFEVGGVSNRLMATWLYDVQAGFAPTKAEVTGDLTLADGAAFAIRAAIGDKGDRWGGVAAVGGELKVGAGSHLYPICDAIMGTAPRFAVGKFTLEEGGEANASLRGPSGAPNDGQFNAYQANGVTPYYYSTSSGGYSPVARHGTYTGGAHGGAGGVGVKGDAPWSTPMAAYDDPYRPSLAGTGGGSGGYQSGGAAGGVVYVEATGAVEVDGTVEADGQGAFLASVNSHYTAGGSGGTIFLSGRTVRGGAAAKLSANGGDSYVASDAQGSYAGAGAGGRIALWSGEPWEDGLDCSRPRVVKSASPLTTRAENVFLGSVSAAGGGVVPPPSSSFTPTVAAPEAALGGAGTIWFCHLKPVPGTTLIVR